MMRRLIDRLFQIVLSKNAYARKKGVSFGRGCRFYITYWGSEPFLITIGNNVTIAAGAQILTHDGATWLVRDGGLRYQHFAPVTIQDDVFVGANAIILPGVTVGKSAIIAAGAIVTRNVSPGTIVGGNPAQSIGDFQSYAQKVRSRYVREDELQSHHGYVERVRAAVAIEAKKNGL